MREITIFNRYTKQLERELVFGERFLRFAYNTIIGQLGVFAIFKRKIFSVIYGMYAKRKSSVSKIIPFIQKYNLREDSFEKRVSDFSSFNDFFTRKLKPSARPISPRPNNIVAPSDGRILAYQSIEDTAPFFVKGEKLSIDRLTKNFSFVQSFKNASLLIVRLAPIDCHRFCFPIDCEPQMTYLINGSYFSVNPIAMHGSFRNFLENKRMSTLLRTKNCGNILMVEIGACCVGSIKQTFSPFSPVLKGQEKGYFEFGGSTVLLLFEQGRVRFDDDLLGNTLNGVETYTFMGDSVATIL